MTIGTTWTDPSEAGTIDLDAGDVLTDVVYDKILSNIAHLGGVYGWHVDVGAATGDWHIEANLTTINGSETGKAVSLAEAFGTSDFYLACMPNAAIRCYWTSRSTTGFVLNNGDGTSGSVLWIAYGRN